MPKARRGEAGPSPRARAHHGTRAPLGARTVANDPPRRPSACRLEPFGRPARPPAPPRAAHSRAAPHPARARRARSGRPRRPLPAAPREGPRALRRPRARLRHRLGPARLGRSALAAGLSRARRRLRSCTGDGMARPAASVAASCTGAHGGRGRSATLTRSSAHVSAGGRPSGAAGSLRASPVSSGDATPVAAPPAGCQGDAGSGDDGPQAAAGTGWRRFRPVTAASARRRRNDAP